MKEFSSQTGGRFTYVDDVINLQELALAFSAIFNDCDNFIVAGCSVTGNSISPGLVYLNGKLRVFNGITGITEWPQYIYEVNTTENTPYQSGGEKVGRNVWGCTAGPVVPTINTSLTNKIPQSIQLTQSGGLLMKDAWFGKYALLLNPASPSQKVGGSVYIDSIIGGSIASRSAIAIEKETGKSQLYYDTDSFVIETLMDGGQTKYKILISNDSGGFSLYKNTSLLATFTDTSITFNKPLIGPQAMIGSVQISEKQMMNFSTASDDGELNINLYGFNGGTHYFRNTHVGNGKGGKLLSVIGTENKIYAFAPFIIKSDTESGIIFESKQKKSDMTLVKTIRWQDSDGSQLGVLGYSDSTCQDFDITNIIGSIRLKGSGGVDIAPEIKENGQLLSEKYVLRSIFNTYMKDKVDATDVYSKIDAESTFAKLNSGFVQFINASHSKDSLCGEIGAALKTDLQKYAKLSNFLSDMAESDAAKQRIRENIGAVSSKDCQEKITDTGWINITDSLFVRQFGNIVSIQGYVICVHEDVAFTLPNKIDPPRYDAPMPNDTYWSCKIEGGQKTCVSTRCKYHGLAVPICITYMT